MSLQEKRKLAQCIATLLEETPEKKREYFFGYADALNDIRGEKTNHEGPEIKNTQTET